MPFGDFFLLLADGSKVGQENPMPMSGTNVYSTDVAVHDAGTPGNHLGIDSDGRVALGAGATLAPGRAATGTGGAAAEVVAANAHRALVKVRNLSAHTVYLGPDDAVTTATGYPLLTGEREDILTTSALWVVSGQTGDAVAFLEISV